MATNDTINEVEVVVAPSAPRISVGTAEALRISKIALEAMPNNVAHQSTIEQWLIDNKLNPLQLDVATKMWNDARTNPNSEFKFLRCGVYALKSSPATEADAPSLRPARKVKEIDPAKRDERIKKLEAQLAALRGN